MFKYVCMYIEGAFVCAAHGHACSPFKRPPSLMELCAVNVRQNQEMSHKQPHGHHFSFYRAVYKDEAKCKWQMLLLLNGTELGIYSFSIHVKKKINLYLICTVNRVFQKQHFYR